MARGVEIDPDVLLGLVVREHRARGDRVDRRRQSHRWLLHDACHAVSVLAVARGAMSLAAVRDRRTQDLLAWRGGDSPWRS